MGSVKQQNQTKIRRYEFKKTALLTLLGLGNLSYHCGAWHVEGRVSCHLCFDILSFVTCSRRLSEFAPSHFLSSRPVTPTRKFVVCYWQTTCSLVFFSAGTVAQTLLR